MTVLGLLNTVGVRDNTKDLQAFLELLQCMRVCVHARVPVCICACLHTSSQTLSWRPEPQDSGLLGKHSTTELDPLAIFIAEIIV